MKKLLAVVVASILLGGAVLIFALPGDPNDPDVFRNVSYGPHDRNTMDIYLPDSSSEMDHDVPVFMYIHGGGWTTGDKKDGEGWAYAVNYLNCILVSINYRFISFDDDSIRCDDILMDIDNSIRFLKDNASAYHIDTTKMAIGGDSAGAHLSLLYSYSMESPIPIKFVMSRVGPTDLTDIEFYEGSAISYPGKDNEKMTPDVAAALVNALAGTKYSLGKLKAQTEETLNEVNAISPIFHVDRNTPRTLLAYGAMDNVVPLSQGILLDSKLTSEGVEHDLIQFPNSWHNLADEKDDDIAKLFLNTMLKYFNEELGTELVQI